MVLMLSIPQRCEASSAIAITAALGAFASWNHRNPLQATMSWKPSQVMVKSPDEFSDEASLIFTGTEVHRSASSRTGPPEETKEETRSSVPEVEEVPPQVTDESSWEHIFGAGVYESKKAVEVDNVDASSWVTDSSSASAVPARMLKAEVYLQAAEKSSPEQWKAKTAERALRIYYHAKWLAERNYARAAEHRYREAAHLARTCRRSVLASHSLARLGYFLVQWKRQAEAVNVLEESMKLNKKSNPLAPYLHGVLERKVAGGDVDRLRGAEQLIIDAGEQPSEELEAERTRLMDEISYWREAEGSAKHCGATNDVAYVLICFFGHVVAFLKTALFK